MEGYAGHKRSREDGDASPEAKRLHVDLLRDILSEDDSDPGESYAPDVELATVIRILEEEIAVSPNTIPSEIEANKSVEIGYLQEASDDELGIPPPAETSSAVEGGENEAVDGFGRIWGYEDDGIPAWNEGLVEFGFLAEWGSGDSAEGVAAGVLFDGDVFDCKDLAWRPTSMSASALSQT
ncbi:hypothetical protein KSP40_PGU017614 [Platanthera guangdongensis]|uniref:Uncharacterized protein n=1 Tax=Platanthera guangdongensis TaxID=2320717 RepID=A0ABR2M2C1_9ASPA